MFLIKMPFLYEHLNGHINITGNGNFNQSFTAFYLSRLWLPDQANSSPGGFLASLLILGGPLLYFCVDPLTSLNWSPFVLLQKSIIFFLIKMTIVNISLNF